MIHSINVFRRSFLYLCILGAFGLVSCASCKQKNAGPLGPKGDPGPPGADGKQGADENKEPDREEKEEIELKLIFNDLPSTTGQASPSTDPFNLALTNNGSKTIQLAKLKIGYTADLVLTYQGGHKTGDAHKDQFIIVRAGEDVDVDNMTLQELTGQAELAAGASVTINTEVKAGEAVDAATTQLKVMEASETRASQPFKFTKEQNQPPQLRMPVGSVQKNAQKSVAGYVKDSSREETNPKDLPGQDELAADDSVAERTVSPKDVHKDKEHIASGHENSSNSVGSYPEQDISRFLSSLSIEECPSQAGPAVGASVTVKTAVKTGEAVDAATTQLKVMEANEARASQPFKFTKEQNQLFNGCSPCSTIDEEINNTPSSSDDESISELSDPEPQAYGKFEIDDKRFNPLFLKTALPAPPSMRRRSTTLPSSSDDEDSNSDLSGFDDHQVVEGYSKHSTRDNPLYEADEEAINNTPSGSDDGKA